MKRILTVVLTGFLVFGLASCDLMDTMLNSNVFKGAVSRPKPQDLTLEQLKDYSDSKAFYDDLSKDPAARAAVLDKVTEGMSSSDKAVREDAAILGTQVLLNTTPAGTIINNAINVVLEGNLEAIASDPAKLDTVLETLIPADVLADKDKFVAMIQDLEKANSLFVALGNDIGATGDYESEEVNAGEIAQNALVCAIVSSIDPPAGSTLSSGEYLYALITDPKSVPAPQNLAMPDMQTGYLSNLLTAANMGDLLSQTAK